MPSGSQISYRLRTLGLSVEHFFKQQRWLWRYKHSKRVAQAFVSGRSSEASPVSRCCLLDLRKIATDGEQGRRFHALVNLLSRGGYQLFLVPHLSFLQTGHRAFKARALESILPFLEDERPADFRPFDLCLRDRRGGSPLARRTLEVLTATVKPLVPGDLALPYSFFPDVWDRREDDRFGDYRRQPRRWRLFFGGHCSQASYIRIRKYPWLQPLDRYRVVQETLRHFRGATLQIQSHEQLASALASRHDAFVIIDNARFRTDSRDWLGLLAAADFFLAAPGCDYPLSHNVIESIAVGTIPVLEYGSLFSPSLRDGENCISYRGRDGLRDALSRIEAMTARQIDELRRGAIEYYEQHLSPTGFCQRLDDPSFDRLHLFSYLTPTARQAA